MSQMPVAGERVSWQGSLVSTIGLHAACYYVCMQSEPPPHLYRCPFCRKGFYTRDEARRHIKEKHLKQVNNPNTRFS